MCSGLELYKNVRGVFLTDNILWEKFLIINVKN